MVPPIQALTAHRLHLYVTHNPKYAIVTVYGKGSSMIKKSTNSDELTLMDAP